MPLGQNSQEGLNNEQIRKLVEERDTASLLRAVKSNEVRHSKQLTSAMVFYVEADEAFIQVLGHLVTDERVGAIAARKLGQIGGEDALDALIGGAMNPKPSEREAVIREIGKIGSAEAVPALVGALSDSDRYVRRNACNALARIADPTTVGAISPLLRDKSWIAWIAAATALADIGTEEAVAALEEASREVNWRKAVVLRRMARVARKQTGK